MSIGINNNFINNYTSAVSTAKAKGGKTAAPQESGSKKAAVAGAFVTGLLGAGMVIKGKSAKTILDRIASVTKEKMPEVESGAKKLWEKLTCSTKELKESKKAEETIQQAKRKAGHEEGQRKYNEALEIRRKAYETKTAENADITKQKTQGETKIQVEKETAAAKDKEVTSEKVEVTEQNEQLQAEKNTEKPAISVYSKLVNSKEEVENPEEVLQVMRELKQQPYNKETSNKLVKLNKSEEYTYASVTAKPDGSQVVTYCDTPNYNMSSPCPHKLIKKTYDANGKETGVLVIRPSKNVPQGEHYLPDFEVLESRNGSELHSIGTVEDTPFGQKVERLFTSMSGTKSEYNLTPTKNGHNIRYKITDKDGYVRMDMKRAFEKIDENHTKTTVNDFVYETEYNADNIIIKKFDKSGNLADTKTLDLGGGGYNSNFWVNYAEVPEYIIGKYKLDRNLTELYKQIEGDFLYKIADMGTRVRFGKPMDKTGQYISYLDTIFLSDQRKNSPFTLLHELGHAVEHNNAYKFESNAHLDKILNNTKQLYEDKGGEIDSDLCFSFIMTGDEAGAESYPIIFGQLSHEPQIAMRSLIFQMEFADYIAERSQMIISGITG